jgi:hypothetical protein
MDDIKTSRRFGEGQLSYEEALLIANVVVETVKGFLSVIAAAPPNRRAPVTAEFTKMLSLYLEAKFR